MCHSTRVSSLVSVSSFLGLSFTGCLLSEILDFHNSAKPYQSLRTWLHCYILHEMFLNPLAASSLYPSTWPPQLGSLFFLLLQMYDASWGQEPSCLHLCWYQNVVHSRCSVSACWAELQANKQTKNHSLPEEKDGICLAIWALFCQGLTLICTNNCCRGRRHIF